MPAPSSYFALSYSEIHKRAVVLATFDELDENVALTSAVIFDGRSFGVQHFKNFAGTSALADDVLWITGKEGEVLRTTKGVVTRERLPDSGYLGRHLGQPNQIRKIGDDLYVCGVAGQVYRRTKGKWLHLDKGLVEKAGTAQSIDLEDIGGTGPHDIYVVGSGGLIAHWNGKTWTRVPPLTQGYLAAIRCFAPNRIVAVVDDGLVMTSDGRKWSTEVIAGCEETTLADVEMFEGRLYVAAVGNLMVRTGRRWEKVKHGLDKKKTSFFKLTTGDGKLWAMGQKRLSSFDGKTWTAHIDPDNG